MVTHMPRILTGAVMHGRLFPKKNHFKYGIYYLVLPLSKLDKLPIPHNSPGLMAFYDADHGYGTQGTLQSWARSTLESHGLFLDGEIVLICMPRIFGYVFNPVSFWLCHDKSGNLKAVLYEVHNTFGEKHTYLCAYEDGRPIEPDATLTAQKIFHVSPFLEREGHYEFRIDSRDESFKVWIDYFDANGRKQLVTALGGGCAPMTRPLCHRMLWAYPLVTFKATFLIHIQALKLVLKGIRYVPKPPQKPERVSTTTNLTKM